MVRLLLLSLSVISIVMMIVSMVRVVVNNMMLVVSRVVRERHHREVDIMMLYTV